MNQDFLRLVGKLASRRTSMPNFKSKVAAEHCANITQTRQFYILTRLGRFCCLVLGTFGNDTHSKILGIPVVKGALSNGLGFRMSIVAKQHRQ
jgi:hypothetical protein